LSAGNSRFSAPKFAVSAPHKLAEAVDNASNFGLEKTRVGENSGYLPG
jgi:hypothetical protein